jgi:hypothetical protein
MAPVGKKWLAILRDMGWREAAPGWFISGHH